MYIRIRETIERATYSDFSDAKSIMHEKTLTGITEGFMGREFATAEAGTALSLALFTTVQEVLIENLNATYYLTAAWTTDAGGLAQNPVRIAAGKALKLVDVRAATGLTLVAQAGSGGVDTRVTAYGT